MSKEKIDDFIKRETQGPSLGKTVNYAAIAGLLVGTAKVLGSILNSK